MVFQPPRGTRDFLPQEMIRRQYVLDTFRRVFELWGYMPLETPAFEDWALLSAKSGGGEEIKNEIYYFKDKAERELGLRFDLTVPMARVVASNPQVPKPFKRYQMGPVWRYDRPGASRWREFVQADVDIVGSSSSLADAEVIAVVCNCLKELGFDDFLVRINNRKLMEALFTEIGIEKKRILDVFRSVDKLEKMGEKAVKEELVQKGVAPAKIDKVLELINSKLGDVKPDSQEAKEALTELNNVILYVTEFGYGKSIRPDLSLMRGLDYYTGPVFEMTVGENKSSVTGGGRYENLVKLFGGQQTPATGWSIGVDRIVEIMKERNMFQDKKTLTQIFIVSVGNDLEIRRQGIGISNKLREIGIACECDLMSRSLSKQLAYANSQNIPYTIIIGAKELEKGIMKLREMKTGKERSIRVADISAVRDVLQK